MHESRPISAKNSDQQTVNHDHESADQTESLAQAEPLSALGNSKTPTADVRRALKLLSKNQTTPTRQQVFRSLQRTYGNRQATIIARTYNSTNLSSTEISQSEVARSVESASPGATTSHIDEARAKADLEKVMARIAKYPSLNKPEFKELFPRYVEMLRQDDKAGARQIMGQMLDFLDSLKAFQVDKKFFKRADRAGDKAAIEEYAQKAVHNVQLWSKVNKFMSMHEAEKRQGVSLEGSLAGSIFDNLTFGGVYNDTEAGNILADQWREISARFMKEARGFIHARVFRGRAKGSVLTTTEWPKIQALLKTGQVKALIVHIFKMRNMQGELEEKLPPRIVTDDATWEAIKLYDDKGAVFKTMQTSAHLHQSELEEQRKQQKQTEKASAPSNPTTAEEQAATSKVAAEVEQINSEIPVFEPEEQEAAAND